jgi:hypothetical protein
VVQRPRGEPQKTKIHGESASAVQDSSVRNHGHIGLAEVAAFKKKRLARPLSQSIRKAIPEVQRSRVTPFAILTVRIRWERASRRRFERKSASG